MTTGGIGGNPEAGGAPAPGGINGIPAGGGAGIPGAAGRAGGGAGFGIVTVVGGVPEAPLPPPFIFGGGIAAGRGFGGVGGLLTTFAAMAPSTMKATTTKIVPRT